MNENNGFIQRINYSMVNNTCNIGDITIVNSW